MWSGLIGGPLGLIERDLETPVKTTDAIALIADAAVPLRLKTLCVLRAITLAMKERVERTSPGAVSTSPSEIARRLL